MQKVLLKFKSIEAKPEILKGNLRLFISYDENNSPKIIEKVLASEDNIEDFSIKLLKEIRVSTKNKYSTKSDNLLDGFVNVVFDEKDIGETEEKFIVGLKKLRDRIRGFRNVKSADNYMNKFFDVSKLEIRL